MVAQLQSVAKQLKKEAGMPLSRQDPWNADQALRCVKMVSKLLTALEILSCCQCICSAGLLL